ncbi:MAG: hypothetical protein AB8B38_08725 [Prochlorococcus sp.]
MFALVIFLLILLLLLVLVIGVGTLILVTQKGPKAEEVKALVKVIWGDLKDLVTKFAKLYNVTEEFVKELIPGQSEEVVKVEKAEQQASDAEVSKHEKAEQDTSIGVVRKIEEVSEISDVTIVDSPVESKGDVDQS